VEVTIRLPDGTTYCSKGVFESATWDTDYAEEPRVSWDYSYPEYRPVERRLTLRLRRVETLVTPEVAQGQRRIVEP